MAVAALVVVVDKDGTMQAAANSVTGGRAAEALPGGGGGTPSMLAPPVSEHATHCPRSTRPGMVKGMRRPRGGGGGGCCTAVWLKVGGEDVDEAVEDDE